MRDKLFNAILPNQNAVRAGATCILGWQTKTTRKPYGTSDRMPSTSNLRVTGTASFRPRDKNAARQKSSGAAGPACPWPITRRETSQSSRHSQIRTKKIQHRRLQACCNSPNAAAHQREWTDKHNRKYSLQTLGINVSKTQNTSTS